MARPLRVEVPGGVYHVIVRGNERKAIFRDDQDREFYLQRLAHYRAKFGFAVWAYCLMTNHVHLALEMGKVPLSRVMAGLQSSYTQYFNRRHRRVGHLFQGRYKAFLVEKDRYALALVRYIHENALQAGVVRDAQRYPWSSARYYRLGKGPEWLDLDRVLRLLGRTRPEAARAYDRLMREEVERESYEEAAAHSQVVKGDQAFADRVLVEAGEVEPIRKNLSVATVARQIGSREKVTQEELLGPSRGRKAARARLLTAWVARKVGGIPLARTAKYFNRDPSTIARGVDRLEAMMEESPSFKTKAASLAGVLRDQ